MWLLVGSLLQFVQPTLYAQQTAAHSTAANSSNANSAAGSISSENTGNQVRGQALLKHSAQVTAKHQTIQARLRVRTDLLGQPLIGSGSYAQLDSNIGPLLRLELAIQAGEQATSVKQISDGKVMWESWRIGEDTKLNRIDLRRVDAAVRQAGAGAVSSSTSASLATGGLPKLLKQLDENFDFNKTAVRQGTIAKLPVFSVKGVWQAEKLAALVPESVEGNTIYFEKLPLHLPHEVEILLGTQNYFPYRVTYKRWKEQDGKLSPQPVVTTEFFEVNIDKALDPSQFQFRNPKELQVTDRTDVYLQSMGLTPTKR